MSELIGPWGTLTVETDMIDITSNLPYPDKSWRYTDAAGHEHYYQDGHYPTLRWVAEDVEPWWCVDCHDYHTEGDGHYECAACGVEVEPGLTVNFGRRYVPGRTSYRLNGEPISEERAREIWVARGDARQWPEKQP